jgi:hypothetical protein
MTNAPKCQYFCNIWHIVMYNMHFTALYEQQIHFVILNNETPCSDKLYNIQRNFNIITKCKLVTSFVPLHFPVMA